MHATGAENCLDCVFGPDGDYLNGCHNIFIDFLPEVLRGQGDDRSLELADRLDLCAEENKHDECLSCPYFSRCKDDDLDFVLEDVFLHLHRKGLC